MVTKKRILILDDDLSEIFKMTVDFHVPDFDAMTATGHDQAHQILQEYFPISCLILDVDLRDTENRSGFDFLDSLQSNSEYVKIPVLLSTTNESATNFIRARSYSRIVGFIPKPFDPSAFIGMLERVVIHDDWRGCQVEFYQWIDQWVKDHHSKTNQWM